jgi:hypothetical protein
MNMFIRSHPQFKIEAEKAKSILRAAREQSWPRKTGQGVKWIFCLTAA